MSDCLHTYSLAIRMYEETVIKTRGVSQIINRGATAMRNWEQVLVTNVEGVEFPPEFSRSNRSENQITGKEWPTAQQIADALLAYHKARQELLNAYNAIPADERHAVRAPEAVNPPQS